MIKLSLREIFFSIVGRVAISLIFVIAGINKIVEWSRYEENLVATLCDWGVHIQGYPIIEAFVQFSLGHIPLILGLATALELVGGLCLFLGWRIHLGAFLVLLFLVPTTFIYHSFWTYPEPRRDLEFIMFLKNIAIFGGVLMVLAQPKPKKASPPPPPSGGKRR